jgi:hypothetical protein
VTTDLERKQAIRDVVARIAHTIDGRRWSELRTLYADAVDTDEGFSAVCECRYEWRNASIGCTRAARLAGATPSLSAARGFPATGRSAK